MHGRGCLFDKEKGRMADNMHYHFQRQNGMDIDWTTRHNQATFIGSAVMLYKATGEKLSGRCRSRLTDPQRRV